MVVMLVDLLESTSIARALAAKGDYELSANQVGWVGILGGVYLSVCVWWMVVCVDVCMYVPSHQEAVT